MAYGNNMFAGPQQPSNNLWFGNNYSYPTAPKNNYQTMNSSIYQPMQMQPQSINNVYQVMGPESAQAYQIGPDSQIILMDSNKPVFYWKRSDSSGYSETRAFEFKEIPLFQQTPQEQIQLNQETHFDYVTKTEFEDFKKMIEELVMKNE